MVVAQIPGIPAGPEVLIILILVIVLFTALVFVLLRSLSHVVGKSNDTRIDELERRVERLEREQK